LLTPLYARPVCLDRVGPAGSVLASVWPKVLPLQASSPDEVDWPEIGSVLARLHRWPLSTYLGPSHGGPARLARAARALSQLAAADVDRATATVPSDPCGKRSAGELTAREVSTGQPSGQCNCAATTVVNGQPRLPVPADDAWAHFSLGDLARLAGALHVELVAQPTARRHLVHGDWHLGQVAQTDDGWRLLDVDDLGLGDPAWDFGRPAGAWAAGMLDEPSLTALLDGYRQAAGPALPPTGDPWPRIDLPARCSVVIALYGLLRDRPAGVEAEQLVGNLVGACARMAALSG
jgi:hypothetical protein